MGATAVTSARLATSSRRAQPSAPAASSMRPSRAQARQCSAGSPANENVATRLKARRFHSASRPSARSARDRGPGASPALHLTQGCITQPETAMCKDRVQLSKERAP